MPNFRHLQGATKGTCCSCTGCQDKHSLLLLFSEDTGLVCDLSPFLLLQFFAFQSKLVLLELAAAVGSWKEMRSWGSLLPEICIASCCSWCSINHGVLIAVAPVQGSAETPEGVLCSVLNHDFHLGLLELIILLDLFFM